MADEMRTFLEEFTNASNYNMSEYVSTYDDGYYKDLSCPFCECTTEMNNLLEHAENCLFLRVTVFLNPEIDLDYMRRERDAQKVREREAYKQQQEAKQRELFERLKQKYGA